MRIKKNINTGIFSRSNVKFFENSKENYWDLGNESVKRVIKLQAGHKPVWS